MPLSGIATSPRERYRRMVNRRLQRYLRAMLIGLGLLPWWLPFARAYLPLDMLWQILDQLFIVVCHRLPARSIELAGVAMPLCTRCAGIFGGLALAAIIERPRVSLRAARWLLLLAGLLMVADVLRQDLGSGGILHPLRILSGVLVGYAATLGLLAALRGPTIPPPAQPDASPSLSAQHGAAPAMSEQHDTAPAMSAQHNTAPAPSAQPDAASALPEQHDSTT